jgi:hypothetical protein
MGNETPVCGLGGARRLSGLSISLDLSLTELTGWSRGADPARRGPEAVR